MKLPFSRGVKPERDARSGRIVAVMHCILNQNARDPGAASSKAVSEKILNLLLGHQAGIYQLPCPEMVCLGLARTRQKGFTIRDMLANHGGVQCCRRLARSAADQLEEHRRNHNEIVAIVGGDVQSPGCAVHHGPDPEHGSALTGESGVFMKCLDDELRARGIRIPFLPMRESSDKLYQEDLQRLDRLLSRK